MEANAPWRAHVAGLLAGTTLAGAAIFADAVEPWEASRSGLALAAGGALLGLAALRLALGRAAWLPCAAAGIAVAFAVPGLRAHSVAALASVVAASGGDAWATLARARRSASTT